MYMLILKFIWNYNKPQIAKIILKRTWLKDSYFLFKTCYNSNQNVWYWHKEKYYRSKDTTESPEIKPYVYGQLIFKMVLLSFIGVKSFPKNSVFNKCCWDYWISTTKRMNLDPYVTLYIKINLKQIKDLNVRANKTLRWKYSLVIHYLEFGNGFFNITLKAQTTKFKNS